MYCDHTVVNKKWRNVSPNIAVAPFPDQITVSQEGVFGCEFFYLIPVTLSLQQTGKTYTMLLFLRTLNS